MINNFLDYICSFENLNIYFHVVLYIGSNDIFKQQLYVRFFKQHFQPDFFSKFSHTIL